MPQKDSVQQSQYSSTSALPTSSRPPAFPISNTSAPPASASPGSAMSALPAPPASNTSAPPASAPPGSAMSVLPAPPVPAPPASNTSPFPPSVTQNQQGQPVPSNPVVAEPATKPQTPSPINIVLFGETGVGKSSVINLIAGCPIAKVSADVDGCTMASTRYDIPVDNASYTIYDTVGLEEPQMGVNGYYDAIEKAYSLIQSLSNNGGIHLLLFCLRGGRITATVQSNYRLFHEFLCDKRVPIALVFTGLEREQRMEDWWSRNEGSIKKYGICSVAHACITAVQDPDDPGQVNKYDESRNTVLELLSKCTKDGPMVMDTQSWLVMLLGRMATFVPKRRRPKRKDYTRVLMKRCGMEPDAAKKVAHLIEGGRT